jgi:hypothetical protein
MNEQILSHSKVVVEEVKKRKRKER